MSVKHTDVQTLWLRITMPQLLLMMDHVSSLVVHLLVLIIMTQWQILTMDHVSVHLIPLQLVSMTLGATDGMVQLCSLLMKQQEIQLLQVL